MPRPIFAHKMHLTRPSAAAAETADPVPPAGERWYALQEQSSLGTTLDTFGMGQMTGTGTATAFQDSTGSYINYATTTLVGGTAGWRNTATDVVQPQILPDLTATIKTGAAASDIASLRIWLGLQTGNSALATDTPSTGGVSVVYFRYSTPGGDSNWQATTSLNGVGDTVTDTGVAVAADTRYIMRIRFVTASSVEFYINGTLVATISTNIVSGTTGLRPNFYCVNAGAGTARNVRIRKFYIDAL